MIKKNIKKIKNEKLFLNNQNNSISNMSFNKKQIPKPLLKWIGGKSQILEKIFDILPKKINNYHEIFVGGGSIMLMMLWAKKEGKIEINGKINVYDLNKYLIETYENIKNKREELFNKLNILKKEFNDCKIDGEIIRKPKTYEDSKTSKESYYYWIRKKFNDNKDEDDRDSVLCSAYFIFLNKTGFRGMYREGPNGYNIPYGNYKNPQMINKEHLYEISDLIKDVNFYNYDFEKSFETIKGKENFIYLDPPYAPENSKSFVGYTKDGFNKEKHNKLFELTKNISKNNKIIMSNSKVELVTDNFKNFNCLDIKARRAINSKNPGSITTEIIIYN